MACLGRGDGGLPLLCGCGGAGQQRTTPDTIPRPTAIRLLSKRQVEAPGLAGASARHCLRDIVQTTRSIASLRQQISQQNADMLKILALKVPDMVLIE